MPGDALQVISCLFRTVSLIRWTGFTFNSLIKKYLPPLIFTYSALDPAKMKLHHKYNLLIKYPLNAMLLKRVRFLHRTDASPQQSTKSTCSKETAMSFSVVSFPDWQWLFGIALLSDGSFKYGLYFNVKFWRHLFFFSVNISKWLLLLADYVIFGESISHAALRNFAMWGIGEK